MGAKSTPITQAGRPSGPLAGKTMAGNYTKQLPWAGGSPGGGSFSNVNSPWGSIGESTVMPGSQQFGGPPLMPGQQPVTSSQPAVQPPTPMAAQPTLMPNQQPVTSSQPAPSTMTPMPDQQGPMQGQSPLRPMPNQQPPPPQLTTMQDQIAAQSAPQQPQQTQPGMAPSKCPTCGK